MAAELGLCVSKDGAVNAEALVDAGAQWARFVADNEIAVTQIRYGQALKRVGLNTLLTFDNESYQRFGDPLDPETWSRAANWSRALFQGLIQAINPTNEPDGTEEESSRLPVWAVNGILRAFRDVWGTDITLVGVGSITGQPSYYDQIDLSLLDAIDFHPYAQWSVAALTHTLDAHAALGKPLWISEVGLNAGDAEQTPFLDWTLRTIRDHPAVRVCTWFCGHEYQQWGILGRPAADAFTRIATEGDPVTDLTKWEGSVGSGLLAMMSTDKTEPAQSKSTWLPLSQTPSDVEECYGKNGVRYTWLLQVGKGYRFRPDQ